MTQFFLKNKVRRSISFTLLLLFVSEIIFPTASMALTGGPSQPEVQSFEPISTSDMVDVFSGDFKYNIPLLDVEGYPINIAYGSAISTDQEASWVGLGWNLNVGGINRSMRGVPDDFKGDVVKKESNMKPNRTFGINAGLDFELFGKESGKPSGSKSGQKFKLKPSVGVGLNYNNYTGYGVDLNVGMGIAAGVGGKGKLDASLGLHSSAKDGLDISPNLSYSNRVAKTEDNDKSLANVSTSSAGFGGTFNTRAGLKNLSFSASHTKSVEKTTNNVSLNSMANIAKGGSPLLLTKDVSTISAKSRGSAGSINFGLQSYVPSITMPMVNNSVALSLKFSTHIFGADANVRLDGFYSSQKLAEKSRSIEAYGYMYSEYGQDNEQAMLDFNREKDGSFSRTTKNLPISNFTYDVYNVAGQGMGGAYRPFRSDVGHVFDNSSYSISDSYSLGAELGGGNLFKAGINISVVDVKSNSGKWVSDNEALDFFKFKGNDGPNTAGSDYEPYYFKQVGEMSSNPTNTILYNTLKGEEPFGIRVQQGFSNASNALNSNLPEIRAKKVLEKYNYDGSGSPIAVGGNTVQARQKRNQPFTTLNKDEAAQFGLQKDLYNGNGVTDINLSSTNKMKINPASPGHHIAEINVLNTDGTRYYYGLPAYNLKTKDVSFTVAKVNETNSGLVSYDPSDATLANEKGVDGNYNMTETPAYAYSYLLTAIVSADYVDVNNNGPDNEDIGTYTKFHYAKSKNATNDVYKWRMPMHTCANYANYNENSKTNVNDNSANYSYGEKELWYLDEIETKNYVAKFILSDRKDGFGAKEDGTIDNTTGPASKKIDKIILYSKPEYLANPSNAVPIKTVNFKYSYNLCKNSPWVYDCGSSGSQSTKIVNNNNGTASGSELSNNGGKLTLEKVYFTYGKSERAVFNQYQFTYANNPDYHNKAYDRWGNYKPIPAFNSCDYSAGSTNLTNSEFPYVDQNLAPATVTANASAWAISKVSLPSGGEINIQYESDDYAFVQNVPAGQMVKVVGAMESATAPVSIANIANLSSLNTLYSSSGYSNYLILDLGSTAITNDADFIKYYLKDISDNNKQLYFKFLVNLTSPSPASGGTANAYEYVSGYADIEQGTSGPQLGKSNGGLIYSSGSPTGKAWIKIKPVNIKHKGSSPVTNPIALAAIQFGRINFGSIMWDANFTPPSDVEDALKQMAQSAAGSLKTLVTGFKNPNKALLDKGYCKIFNQNKSMVRLYNPTGNRLGGGSRVKTLKLKDNWDVMTVDGANPGQKVSEYGQVYSYTTKDEFGRDISSGVASYEPMVGGEENMLKQPFYLGKNKWSVLAPDDRYYVEGPFGESFYPAPSVGYSKVTVKSYVPNGEAPSNLYATTASRNGSKVYEFYTAKDYPTICKHTPIMPKQYRSPLKSLVKISSKDLISASQGYVIMTNDMHGKPKAEYDYAEGKFSPEKETRFYYRSKGGYQEPSQRGLYSDASYSANQLFNTCTVVAKDGKVNTAPIGIDFDAISDFRESETETNMFTSQNNASSFLVGIFPALVPTIWPSVQYELSRFRSAVLTKVINQYGILERTEVKIDKSAISSESLAFDVETGEPIISKTINDFEDPIYNVKYPAHWGYQLMGGAYSNVGLKIPATSVGSGNYTIPNASNLLNPGDELGLTAGAINKRVWVCNVSGTNVSLTDENGNPVNLTPTKDLKVLRSAKRNIINTPMQVLTCLTNPLPALANGTQAFAITPASQIIDTKGTVFSDQWQIPKGYVTPPANNCNCNLSQTASDLITFIENLFNTKNNYPYSVGNPCCPTCPASTSFYSNAFLNGSLLTPINNSNLSLNIPIGFDTKNMTGIYKDALQIAPNVGAKCISNGLNTPLAAPDYNNYGFTSLLMNQLPYYPSMVILGNPISVAHTIETRWYGPGLTSANPFNANNQLVGALYEFYSPADYNNSCAIALDFGTTPVNWTPTLQGYFSGLAQPSNSNYVDIVPAINQSACTGNEIACDFVIKNSSNVTLYAATIKIISPCLLGNLTANCTSGGNPNTAVCGKLENAVVNPYFLGIKGNWRSKSEYTYLTDRSQSISTLANGLNTNARKDGYYLNYADLYVAPASPTLPWLLNPSTAAFTGINKWVNTVQTTKYNQFGVEIETKDALGRYSSALYGYNESFPIATASNAQLQEIAYDGFEDYAFYYICKKEHHFDFYSNMGNLTSNEAHTGKYSINIPAGSTFTQNKKVVSPVGVPLQTPPTPASANYACSYVLKPYDFIYPFSPIGLSNASIPGLDYVISYWVKESYTGSKPLDYTTNQVTVTQGTGPAFATKNLKRSAIIDGWQRVEYTFTLPYQYYGALSVNLKNPGTGNVYIDDIRMHPYSSNMKSYVYHPVTLKYVAELDANNFATFYEYDEQGNLIRVKKETERGIMTIKESKTHYYKQ